MYVFRQTHARQPVDSLVAAVRRLCRDSRGREDRLELLLAAAALECALADYWGTAQDDLAAGQRAALAVTLAAARSFLRPQSSVRAVAARLADLDSYLPPAATALPVGHPEGFRYYGLSPRSYVPPAYRLARAAGGAPVFVLGLRTIGSCLAALVAAVLAPSGDCALATVRPRGAPKDRHFAASPRLETALARWPGLFALVDEGPGLSGSSFGGAMSWLEGLGISSIRVVLLPSWNPAPERLSHTVVARSWAGWQKFPATAPRLAAAAGGGADLSAGQWRRALGFGGPIPVWPQRERLKILSRDGRSILKFGGLAGYGREAAARARSLATAGFAPPAEYVGDGWLRSPRLRSSPLVPAALDGLGPRWAEWAGRYFSFLRATFAQGAPEPPSAELAAMVATNCTRLLGRAPRLPLPPAAVPVRLDGRLQAHEWGLAGGRFVKFDALDHGDDHFFPGPTDIAWDLAGLEFEFGPALARAARAEYARRAADPGLGRRLPWFRLAYGIFHAAFAEFARELVGAPDCLWFAAARDRYLRRLRLPLGA